MSIGKTVEKSLIDPTRRRCIPANFSWIDRRFLREGWIDRLARDEILLYFFLVAVADRDGLSYWGEERISASLRISPQSVRAARERLAQLGLIAYRAPLYQVLSLPALRSGALVPFHRANNPGRTTCLQPSTCQTIGEILKQAR